MAANTETVTSLVKRYANDVRTVFNVDKVVLYGSHAKGTATEQSDIDVCFFLNDFNGQRRVDVIKKMLGIMRSYKKVHFEPIVFPSSEMQNDNPFVKEILRTGMEV